MFALFVTQLYFFLHVFWLDFKIQSLSEHIIAYCVSFDSPTWTLKSDIIRGSYDLFYACGRPCLSLPYLFHNFTFSFMSLVLSFKIYILSFYLWFTYLNSKIRSHTTKIWLFGFTYLNSKIWFHTTNLWAFWCMRSLLSLTALFVTTLLFPSCLTTGDSKFRFCQTIS